MLESNIQHINEQWLNAIAFPIVFILPDGRIERLNTAASQLFDVDSVKAAGANLCETPLLPELCNYLKARSDLDPSAFPIKQSQTIIVDELPKIIQWEISLMDDSQEDVQHLVASGQLTNTLSRLNGGINTDYYHDIIQQSPNAIQVIDADGIIVDVNQAHEEITGLSRSNIIGHYAWDVHYRLTPLETRQASLLKNLKQRVMNTLENQDTYHDDYPIVRFDGGRRSLQMLLFSIKSNGSHMACAMMIDLTMHHEMESALIDSEQRYQLLVKNLPTIGIVLYDHDLRFNVVDGKALAKMGIDPAKLKGHKLTDIMPPESAQATATFYRAALEGHTLDFEYQYGDYTFELHTVPVRDNEGKIKGGMMIAIDVTQRKFAEIAARNSEQRYRLLIDSMQEGMMILSENGRITYVNDKLLEIVGYRRDDLVGQHLLRLSDSETRKLLLNEYRILQDGKSHVFEQPFLRKDGEKRYAIVASTPFMDDRGFFRGAFAVVTDITDRKSAEDALLQSNEELDAFAHTVAHDLKNPLATAQGFANLLLDIHDDITPEELTEYLTHIKQSNDRMMNIIDELLLLSEMRDRDVETVALDMQPLVESAIERLSYMIDQQPEPPVFEIGDVSQWATSVGYPAWIEEIWTNYISNSIKYGGSPAIIKLGAEVDPKTGQICYWVQDNGSGVPQDKRDQLFVAFNRFDKVRAEGHGLGLSIVKRIINRLGGEVGYDFLDGIGSRFYFTLPPYTP